MVACRSYAEPLVVLVVYLVERGVAQVLWLLGMCRLGIPKLAYDRHVSDVHCPKLEAIQTIRILFPHSPGNRPQMGTGSFVYSELSIDKLRGWWGAIEVH